MKERGIIMSGDNPKLIQDGRMTQTRRVIVPQPYWNHEARPPQIEWPGSRKGHTQYFRNESDMTAHCPYGVAGDRPWVRETHAWADYLIDGLVREDAVCVAYKTDGEILRHEGKPPIRLSDKSINLAHSSIRWRPSIHMPRWASRITLEITRVRVERVQAISYKDALAEGMKDEATFSIPNAIANYMGLWDSLHGKGARERNDWVWALDFKKS